MMYQFTSTSKSGERIHASRESEADCLTEMRKYHRVIKMVPGLTVSSIIATESRTGFTSITAEGHVTLFEVREVAEVEA